MAGLELLALAPEWLQLLTVGAVGGVAVGWLLVSAEEVMQKWRQRIEEENPQSFELDDSYSRVKCSDSITINDIPIQVAEAITIEFQNLISFENSIESSDKEQAFGLHKEQKLRKRIKSTNDFIRDVQSHSSRLKQEWYNLSLKERQALALSAYKELSYLLKEESLKEDALITIRVPDWKEISQALRAVASFNFPSKEYYQRLDKVKAELEEADHHRHKTWAQLLCTIINLSLLDEVSLYYELINPIEITDFIVQDETLRGKVKALQEILVGTAQKIQQYFESDIVGKPTLELIKYEEFQDEEPHEFQKLGRLIVFIHTGMDIEDAYDKLRDFKLYVWIDYVGDLLPKVSVDVVHEVSVE